MKIVFDANPIFKSNKSGVGYFTHNLISSLSRCVGQNDRLIGQYHNFLGRNGSLDDNTYRNTTFKETRLVPTKIINVGRRLGFQPPYESLVHTRADVFIFTNFVAMPVVTGGKVVSIIYDLGFLDCPEYIPDRLVSYLKKWVPYTVERSDLIIVNSDFTKSRLLEYYHLPAKKIIVIPIPPAPHVRPDSDTLGRHKISKPYILFMGTIEPRKNIVNLVKAFAALPTELRDKYSLVLAGGKGWKDSDSLVAIQEAINNGASVVKTGYISDDEKAALYKNSLFCVQPSHYEGFGMPILEAMSYGRAIACSNIEVFKEVASTAAYYFDQDKYEDISLSLANLLNDRSLRTNLETKSRKRIESYTTWDEIGASLYDRLKKLG